MTLTGPRATKNPPMAIRGFGPDDADAYVELLIKTSEKEYSNYGRRDIACMVSHLPRSCIRVAGTRGCPRAGFVTAVPEGPNVHLLLLDVHPDHQGKGIGALLLASVIAEARAKGKKAIICEVWDGNRNAVKFYTRHGFQRAKWLYDYYENGLDAWLMVRFLGQNNQKKKVKEVPRARGRSSERSHRSRPRRS